MQRWITPAMLTEVNNLNWMSEFYNSLCDGEWEHGFGFSIENIDNPGWSFCFDSSDTVFYEKNFTPVEIHRSDDDWIVCKIEDGKFTAYCGPLNLDEVLTIFRGWIELDCPLK